MTVTTELTALEGSSAVVQSGRPVYRWVILLFAWACYLMSSVDRFAWSSLSLQAQPELGLPLAQLATFVTAYFAGYVASNCISGVMTDRLGPRLCLGAAVIGTGIFTVGFGFTHSYWAGLALQCGMGFATGADYAACIKIVAGWFEREERGRALGIWFTATSLGVVTANSLALPLASVLNWRGAYIGLGAVTISVGLLSLAFLRDGPSCTERKTEPLRIRALLRNRNLVLVSMAGFCALWGTWGFVFSANALMVKGAGMTQAAAAAVVATFGVGGFIAKPLIGAISDWLGARRKWPAIACLAGFVTMLIVFALIRNESWFFVAGPLLGVAAFVYSPMLAALVAEAVPRDSTGTASGLSNALWQLAGVVVPVAVGYAFSQSQSFTVPFVVLALGPFLGILCLLAVKEKAPSSRQDV
jgi:sugar phosphate permease